MADWTYGHEGTRFPVEVGSTWRVGGHLAGCGDLMAGGQEVLAGLLALSGPPTLLYTDPPWQQGNLNSFRTKAGLAKAPYHYLDLYRRILSAAPVPAWVESGVREREQVAAVLPGPVTACFPVTYYRKHPSLLHYSGPTPPPVDPTGLDDDYTPGRALSGYPAGIVLDPCAGRGLTALSAERAGWRSVNLELSPYRTSVLLSRLTDLTGDYPVRIT